MRENVGSFKIQSFILPLMVCPLVINKCLAKKFTELPIFYIYLWLKRGRENWKLIMKRKKKKKKELHITYRGRIDKS